MADASGYTQEQPLPVPKPRPRRPRTGLATGVGAESEKQPSGAVLRRERGASESEVQIPLSGVTALTVEDPPTTGRAWTHMVQNEEDLYEAHPLPTERGCDGGPASTHSDLNGQLQSLTERLTSHREEEAGVSERVRGLGEEEKRLEQALQEKQKDATANLTMIVGELEKRIDRLREEETRLKAACEERERQKSALESDFHIDDRFRQREMELQRLLDEASDRESANRQENLRLQRLTDQLHMQKKDLDHQRFDLENFGGDMSEEKKAELRERERRLEVREMELVEKERELDMRQANFQKWMREQQSEIQQRLSQLELDPRQSSVPPSSSYHHSHTVTHPQPHAFPPSHPPPPPVSSYGGYNKAYTQHFSGDGGDHYGGNSAYYTGPQPQPYTVAQDSSPGYNYPPVFSDHIPQFPPSHSPLPLSSSSHPHTSHPPLVTDPSHPHPSSTHSPHPHPSHAPLIHSASSPSFPRSNSAGGGRNQRDRSMGGQGIGGVGVVSGGAVSGSSTRNPQLSYSARRVQVQMSLDEEVARRLRETIHLNQTTDDISADAELARKLQQELNAPPRGDQDLQLALAMYAVSNEELPDVSNTEAWERFIDKRLKEEEQRKRQEERDAELARRLHDPDGEDELNDLR